LTNIVETIKVAFGLEAVILQSFSNDRFVALSSNSRLEIQSFGFE